MATRTHRPCSFGGVAHVEYDYDDATGEVLRVRVRNDSDAALRVRLSGTEGDARGWRYERTIPAHSGLTTRSIPPGQRKRFPLIPDGGSPDPAMRYATLGGLSIEVDGG